MADRLALLADQAVRSAFARQLGRDVEYHSRIGSTQDRARELRVQALVVADEQMTGHGRNDREWAAVAGSSLLASWRYVPAPLEPGLCALVSGVAVARALASLGHSGARVKWPNDVLLGGKKVAGVLAHGVADGEAGSLVIGIGVNVHQAIGDFGALRDRAISLALSGPDVDRLTLLARLTLELDRAVADPKSGLREWRERSAVLGKTVEITRPGAATLRGVARDIAEDGSLILTTPQGEERVVAGEVSLIP